VYHWKQYSIARSLEVGYRYIGSKNKIVDTIVDEITQLTPENGRVTDLMCGTSAISAALRTRGFAVTANDLMTFCYHHAVVNLCFTSEPLFANAGPFLNRMSGRAQPCLFEKSPYERVIGALDSIQPVKGYFWREFSLEGRPANGSRPRNYFTPANAMKIDGIRCAIQTMRRNEWITEKEEILLRHDLVMASNDVANIAGTYGHYLSKTVGRAAQALVMQRTNLLLRDDPGRHEVFCGYAEEIASKISCDVCYIDPPYMKRQYAANYHILETLARGDEPRALGRSGLRPWRDQYSNFCTKTHIGESFARVFTEMDCPNFLVSYSEDGLLGVEELKELFSRYGDVSVKEFTHKRFKSNNSQLAPTITEYLLHLSRNARSKRNKNR
jgi:adenine-specific DNA-methyltransferase